MISSRRARVSGGDRGDETRQRLIKAAIDVFGRFGYEGASTRALAEAAGANLAAIPYHFGGKEGLYLATASYIAERIAERVGPVAERVAGELTGEESGPADRDACLRLLQELLDRFAELVVLEEEAGQWARLVVREQMHPTRAFEILYDGIMKKVLRLLATLIGRLTGVAPDNEVTRLRALTLLGQVLMFRTAHAAALRQMGWDKIGPRELAAIQAVVRENVVAIAGASAGDGDKAGAAEVRR
ncbi:CerR family C-terminal domain-containing protein [Rhodospirillaceae bacterium SYSU D60014]|uniref:CerR family C-terminal domain-containing protein n=1 Tax=Virgifigura deserti TaxID=2268457 RepID=UPI000E666EDD